MRTSLRFTTLLMAGLAIVRGAGAQGVGVVGVAFDSLHHTPLRGAFVTLAASGRQTAATTSDSAGVFRFERTAPGAYTIAMQAAVFDSIGLTGTSARVTVSDGRDTIRIASPSREGLWRVACGDRPLSPDTGFVFGTVRAADTRRPVAGAVVSVRWLQLMLGGTAVEEQPWVVQTRTDSSGDYRACGLPSTDVLHEMATLDTPSGARAGSGEVELVPNGLGVDRMDLLIGEASGESAARASGVVIGVVTDEQGAPLTSARIRAVGVPEIHADRDGRFVIPSMPAGSHQLDVSSIGLAPAAVKVDVYPRDTARLSVQLRKVTMLAAVQVKAAAVRAYAANQFTDRRRKGLGYFADSTTIGRHGTISSVFESIPRVRVDHRGVSVFQTRVLLPSMNGRGSCLASIWIDGSRADPEDLGALYPSDVAAVEVYPDAFSTPVSLASRDMTCGVVAVWTKRAFP